MENYEQIIRFCRDNHGDAESSNVMNVLDDGRRTDMSTILKGSLENNGRR